MRLRGLAAGLAAVVLSATGAALVPAQAASPVTIAVLDSGIFASSQEFAPGQIVAWRDFVANHAAPYDDNGHGTLTASMAAGINASAAKTPSFAPGARLAIGKVVDADGSASDANLAAGIAWAVGVGADIISISLSDSTPGSTLLHDASVHNAAAAARQAGVLVVVANGNGVNNSSLPGLLGPLQADGASPDVLAVGASGLDGLLVTAEPEVVAQYTVTGPSHTDPHGYITESGTSFSTPLVAGFAAHALAAARDVGRNPRADELEALVKACARDNLLILPTFEGYGTIDAAQVPCALNGAVGVAPEPDAVNAIWVEEVSGTLRSLFG